VIDLQTSKREHGNAPAGAVTTRPAGHEQGVHRMLLQEELARARIREAAHQAARQRQARNLCAARRWARLARWATRRAEQARVRADAAHLAAGYRHPQAGRAGLPARGRTCR
jgi:hypothetical protein